MAKKRMFTKSIKHYVQHSITDTASGAVRVIKLVDAVVEGAARGATNIVWEGSHVETIYVEHWLVNANATNETQFVVALILLPSGAVAPTAADMVNLSAYTNKKNVLYVSQGVLGFSGSQAVPVMREWHLIPSGKTRMGQADEIILVIAPVGASISNCGISTYKEKS